jgi:hypothetical protein
MIFHSVQNEKMSIEQTQDPDGTLITRKVTLENGIKRCVIHSDDGPAVVHPNGDQEWWTDGSRRNEDDKPSIVRATGRKEWWNGDQQYIVFSSGDQMWLKILNGVEALHRIDGPAIIRVNGDQEWWEYGFAKKTEIKGCTTWFHLDCKAHRERIGRDDDLPAIIHPNGDKEWYKMGKRHRDNGLPAIERANGDQEWWADWRRHREDDKPNVVRANGDQEWLDHRDRLHRFDGPAVIRANGDQEWWESGKRQDAPRGVTRMKSCTIC